MKSVAKFIGVLMFYLKGFLVRSVTAEIIARGNDVNMLIDKLISTTARTYPEVIAELNLSPAMEKVMEPYIREILTILRTNKVASLGTFKESGASKATHNIKSLDNIAKTKISAFKKEMVFSTLKSAGKNIGKQAFTIILEKALNLDLIK